MNLREQIAGIITGELDDCGYAAEVALGKADRILAISEIADALKLARALTTPGTIRFVPRDETPPRSPPIARKR